MIARGRHEDLLDEIRREFPDFELVPKRERALQRTLAIALAIVTLGGQRRYLTHYHTALFGKLYVPDAWYALGDEDRTILLRHERVHLRQRRRMGGFAMGVVYLLPFFPLFLAWGRARIEWEAYRETIRATAEIRGLAAARALEDEIVARYVGPDYGWMWPFRRAVRRWFAEAIAEVERSGPPGL